MNIINNYIKLIQCTVVGIIFSTATFKLARGEESIGKSKPYNKELFVSEIKNNNHFIMFYAPWCTHCKRLSPTWEELAQIYNEDPQSQVVIAQVDCTVDTELCSTQDVTGYPTLKLYKAGAEEDAAVKFKGTRDLPTLMTFIRTNLESIEQGSVGDDDLNAIGGLIELTDVNFEKTIDNGSFFVEFYAPWCGHCQKLAPTWEELASTFASNKAINIAKVDCTQQKSTCSMFDVKGYPTLIWFQDGKKVEVYRGPRTHEDLKAFVLQMAGTKSDDKEDEAATDTGSPIVNLLSNNFEARINAGYTFVKFYAPWCGHCKRLAPTWEELSKKFSSDSDITIAKVDCTVEDNKQLCNDQEVNGYPTLFLYHNGAKISEYDGARDLDDLVKFVNSHTASHDEL